ncbi:PREDICTED: plastin-2 isoform X2 [Nicrophorus vespilloides]|uniref:Plastin-2 isoform X2 n=1 Tax=Nicrophorus vespilloides TaxID=110193 RepID=A0ABM1N5T2_NICVS|nr:PREDICTED: plastin-2 isoform X2 [Nicrophorus vespilloides]
MAEKAKLTMDEQSEIKEQFTLIDTNNDGFIDIKELREALTKCGFKLPGWQVRQMEEEFKNKNRTNQEGKLSYDEFEKLCSDLKANEVASKFKQVVTRRENLQHLGGTSNASNEGTTHSVRVEEQLAFSDWINANLKKDKDLQHLLPIDSDGKSLYDKVTDGILLCKVINHSCPDTIDERTINKKNLTLYTKLENLTLALYSSQAIGCNVVNIDAHSLSKGTPHLVLGLLWQIIRIGLFNQISLENCPGLTALLADDEKIEDLLKLSPEAILLRWVNYHMERAGVNRRVHNFTSDIVDSEVYTHLLKQIAPQDSDVNTEALYINNLEERAELMLKQAAKLKCRSFVTPQDVINGVYKLNLAFVANLFNNHPALEQTNGVLEGYETVEETREEKTYRNWINSMGVSPHVNWLYSDLADGLVVFQLYDIIKPGIVNWNKVHRKFSNLRKFMEKLENCNYAIELGREIKFSLVGIAGQDIREGNVTLTLALIWQLMRAYTLSVLTQLAKSGNPIVEKEIVQWVNKKLSDANKKSSIKSFQDSSIADATVVIDLIDSIKPGAINYDLIKTGGSVEDNLDNAKYAISMARKNGARVYALPEDITEVKPKMVMTVFACLMALDYVPTMDSAPEQ